jgi:hypothetical protein
MGRRTSPEIPTGAALIPLSSLDPPSPRLYTHLIRSLFPERTASEGLPDRGPRGHI